MAIGVRALVGTRWGLFVLWGDDDRRGWRVDGPMLEAGVCTRRRSMHARHGLRGGEPHRLWPDGATLGRRRQDVEAVEEDPPAPVVGADYQRNVAHRAGLAAAARDAVPQGRSRGCSSALMMPGKPGSRTAASWRTPRVIAGFLAAAGCFAIRSSLIQASRYACTSVSPRSAHSEPMMADKPGCWSTRMSRPSTFPSYIRKPGSACTSCCCTRRGRNACGSKTTAVSTAPTIAAIPGSG